MKYAILLGDGIADYPIGRLSRRTPLEAARTPNMDRIAREGTIGLINTIPSGFPPGSDVANLSVLGYDPEVSYTGRGPLEAASMGIVLGPDDVAFRCNLVTLGGDATVLMEDYAAGHISSQEAKEIIDDLGTDLGAKGRNFYAGVGYRHLLVWDKGPSRAETTPPHDIVGQAIANHLPRGEGSGEIRDLMERSWALLKNHRVNVERIAAGKRPANSIWLWGQGRQPVMETLAQRFRIRGVMISAVDLLRGIGIYAGLEVLRVSGATGYVDTDYEAKAEKALEALKEKDFVFVHVEAPDEMGHEGNLEGKIQAIEDFDEKIVGTVLKGIRSLGDFRLMVLSDHATPISRRTHVNDPSPFAVFSSVGENLLNGDAFCEKVAQKSGLLVMQGHRLIESFIGDWGTFIGKKGR